MSRRAEELEDIIGQLRTRIREAAVSGDRERATLLRRELRQAEREWDQLIADADASAGTESTAESSSGRAEGPLLPLREQVHEALALLTVPAAPRLIATVHEAFFASTFPSAKLTSLKRDEERSFRVAPNSRPYYICAALAADFLAPSRGLLAISTWPMESRVIGSLSPRVDFLTAAIQVANKAERIPVPVPAARKLLWRFAASIPGAAGNADQMEPQRIIEAAEAERKIHEDEDAHTRQEAASRARAQLDDVQRLFGAAIRTGVKGKAARNSGGGAG
jgi:hypothetical protein